MQRPLRVLIGLLALEVVAFSGPVWAQDTRVLTGVVVDADSGAPVSDAVVTIGDTGQSVLTDEEGRFEVAGVPLGELQLVLRHLAYGEQTERLAVGASGSLDFRILVSSRAIELEPLGVEVPSSEALERRALGTAGHVIDRETIEAFAPRGQGLQPLLQSRVPSLRVDGYCVEYRFQQHRVFFDPENPESLITVPCRDITVYVDGVPNPQGSEVLQQLSPQNVERIQVLSPAEAGVRYVAGSRGVILVEMREGVGRDTPYRIHVNGFGWNEPESYPWLRVLGLSALGNALMIGIASNTLLDCSGNEESPRRPRCHGTAGISAALLTGAVGPLMTRGIGNPNALSKVGGEVGRAFVRVQGGRRGGEKGCYEGFDKSGGEGAGQAKERDAATGGCDAWKRRSGWRLVAAGWGDAKPAAQESKSSGMDWSNSYSGIGSGSVRSKSSV